MNFPQFNFSPNSLVSMHQLGTSTKVVGSVSPNIAFIPATNTQHFQNHSSLVSFTNSITSTNIDPNHYQDSHRPSAVSNQNITSNSTMTVSASTAAQTSCSDSANHVSSNSQKSNLITLPPYLQTNHSQPFQRTSTVAPVMKSVATMTDFVIPLLTPDSKTTQNPNASIEDSNDSSKSSTTNNSFQKPTCSNSCSKIYLKNNASAMATYLDRLQQSEIPPNIEDFLKTHNIKTNHGKIDSIDEKKDCEDNSKDIPEIRLSTAIDGSLLYCCSECQIAYPQKELLERHLSVHRSERKFECNVCGVCLKRKEHLDQHKRGHSEDRPFVCEICCKGFKRNEHLRRHIVIHSGDKNHLCIHCGKAFSRKDHLNKHLQTHNNKQGKQESSEPTSPLLQIQTQNHKSLGHS